MRKIYNYGDGIYRNQMAIGKVFQINGFDITKYKSNENSFLQKFVRDAPSNVGLNFWNVGRKSNKEDYKSSLEKLKQHIKKKFAKFKELTGVEFTQKQFEEWFDSYKKQFLGIYSNELTIEENYFGYFLPVLYGYQNNPKDRVDIKPQEGQIINTLHELQVDNIFKNFSDIEIKPGHPNIFPLNKSRSNVDKYFEKYKDNKNNKTDKIMKDLFEHFCNEELSPFMNRVKKEKTKEETKMDAKKKVFPFLNQVNAKNEVLGEELYTGLNTTVGNGYYFYPQHSMYLKVIDMNFVGRFNANGVLENQVDMGLLKEILKTALKNDHLKQYVIKTNILKKEEEVEFDNDDKYIYVKDNQGNVIYRVPIGDNINYNYLQKQEKNKVEFHFSVTLGLYGEDRFILDRLVKKIIKKYQDDRQINLQLDSKLETNVFNYNNWLSVGFPEKKVFNVSNFLPFSQYGMNICPQTNDFNTETYLGLNTESNSPVFKNPFQDLTENKNMAVFGKSGSGKTVYLKQFLLTNHSDKVFVIDPAGTFANLGKKDGIGVNSFRMGDLDFNPIQIDKKFYDKMGMDYTLLINDKIDLFLKILNIDKEKDNKNNWVDFFQTLLLYLYKNNEQMNLEIIKTNLEKIIKDIEQNEKITNKKLKLFLKNKNIVVMGNMLKFYSEKLQSVLLSITGIENTLIGKMLKKEKDIIPFLFQERFVIFNIVELNLTEPDCSKENLLVLLYLFYSLSLYTRIYKNLFEKYDDIYEGDYSKRMNNYIVLDEAHIMTKDERLLKKLDADIRIVRNRQSSMVLLTQSLKDISEQMGDAIMDNINIKVFFKFKDAKGYFDYLMQDESSGNDDGGGALKEHIENIKLYLSEFKKIQDHKKKIGDKVTRHVFMDYAGKILLNKVQLSQEFWDRDMF